MSIGANFSKNTENFTIESVVDGIIIRREGEYEGLDTFLVAVDFFASCFDL